MPNILMNFFNETKRFLTDEKESKIFHKRICMFGRDTAKLIHSSTNATESMAPKVTRLAFLVETSLTKSGEMKQHSSTLRLYSWGHNEYGQLGLGDER